MAEENIQELIDRLLDGLSKGGYLGEKKLGQIWSAFNDPNRAVALITAFQFKRPNSDEEVPYEENVRHNTSMAIDFWNTKKIGFVYLDGNWIYNKGQPDEKRVPEVSVFVSADKKNRDILFKACCEQAAKYNQQSFLFKEPEDINTAKLYRPDGSLDTQLGTLHFDKMGDVYSAMKTGSHGAHAAHPEKHLKGGSVRPASPARPARTFMFEQYIVPDGMFSRMKKSQLVKLGYKFDPKYF